ncbi:2-dehydro-3-deoxy-phosphogluconate aldolase [Chelativorans sp. J32]|uniref:2-dehydro-3-deoxy-phosphogluconate aldolase n=1 Tax=Chelativorans sp. J32 TaxID=935840 RepID=UPI0004850CFB|nr:2-dehydro-3-deoxy-phosphogluconate aldolase [Chelativorans sp. J32]
MKKKTEKLLEILTAQPVIPVLKIDRLSDAVPLARALAKGGLPAIEITLRTPDAIDAIRLVVDEVPEAIVGAGTILTKKDFTKAEEAGASFIVSPGTTEDLLDAAEDSHVPFLPGAVTPSEIMALREEGYRVLKFFPAEQAGGAAFLKSLASPLADMRFCPTGGISPQNAGDYLSLPNIVCVGGSWIAPDAELKAGNWAAIEELSRQATGLRQA